MGIKAREIRNTLGTSVDPKLLKVLIMLAEGMNENEKTIIEFANTLNRLIDHQSAITEGALRMGHAIEKMPGGKAALGHKTDEDLGGDDGNGSAN